jgi:hypothetical protein
MLTACAPKEAPKITVTVQNPTGFDRLSEMAEIPLDSLNARIPLTDTLTYVVRNDAGEIVPSQITYDGLLIFQAGVKAASTARYTIAVEPPQIFSPKTYGRYIKERKDDFAWENDRVAFRIYGPALAPVDGPSNGLDLWYKKTSDLIINKWYADDLAGKASYHNDNGQGLDDYKVGRTLGAGAMAPYVDSKLWLNENYVAQELLENGPLRTSFRLSYKDININDSTYSESRLFSIDAGAQLTKITQTFGFPQTTPVAAGIVKRDKDVPAVTTDSYMLYPEPATNKAAGIFVGLVFTTPVSHFTVDSYEIPSSQKENPTIYRHSIAVMDYHPDTPITYYSGYGWTQFGFPTVADFATYLENFATALRHPLEVELGR